MGNTPLTTTLNIGEAVRVDTNTIKQGKRSRRIDYIFATPQVQFHEFRIIKNAITETLFLRIIFQYE